MKGTGAKLVVRKVQLSFGGIQALRSVSFEAAPSELIALVGPNGAGKTAMLNCINGIYHPHSGEISLDGKTLRDAHCGRWWSSASAAPFSTPNCFHT